MEMNFVSSFSSIVSPTLSLVQRLGETCEKSKTKMLKICIMLKVNVISKMMNNVSSLMA